MCSLLFISLSDRSPCLSFSQLVALNNGQEQVRGVCTVMKDSVDCLHKVSLRFRRNGPTCVRVAIKTWEVRAGHLQADAMSDLEDVGGGPQVEVQLVDLLRLQQFRLGERLAIAGT